MASRSYENFDLLVERLDRDDPPTFRARVTSSPVGDGASATFAMPFDATELENLLLKLDPGRSQMRRATADPRPAASKELGGALFEAAFGDEVLLAWTRSLDTTRDAGKGLRVRLQLTDAPDLAGLPWELLYDRRSNSYLAQSERTPVVRYLEVSSPPRPLTVDGPLKILVVLSSPTDLPELDVEAEWRRLQDSLRSRTDAGTVQLDRLPAPTTSALAGWLRTHEVHVLHVIGHGDVDEHAQAGVLYFCDAYGRSVPVSADVLGPYLHDHDPLRLVFLNACQSGRLGAADPFSGLAQRLVQQDCTAVVAMQFPISDGAATAFTGEFYAALTDGMPVDQATTSARKALLAGFASEWATPVLYLRAPDGRVFDAVGGGGQQAATAGASAAPVRIAASAQTTAPSTTAAPTLSAASAPGPRRVTRRRPIIGAAAGMVVLAAAGVVVAVSRNSSASAPETASSSGALAPAAGSAATPGSVVPGVSPPPASGALVSLEGPQFPIYHMASPPTIDGDGSDWPTVPQQIADQRTEGDVNPAVKGVWSLGWDADRLYLFVDVTDPQLTQTHAQDPAKAYQGDSIGLQFGAAGAPADKISLNPADVDLTIAPLPDGGVVTAVAATTAGRFDAGTGAPVKGLQGRTKANGHGYTIEASIPWSSVIFPWSNLGFTAPTSGSQVGMNLFVNDAVPSGSNAGSFLTRMGNNRNSMSHNAIDGSYRMYWGVATLQG